MKALVLSGGGARGAYQVGVLKAIGALAKQEELSNPFPILCGVSAGAINASFLASRSHQFSQGTEELVDLWSSLTSDQVYRTDVASLSKTGLQWMAKLSFGGHTRNDAGRALLDTEPLLQLLRNNIDTEQIKANLLNKSLSALAISALDYHSSQTITFVQSLEQRADWYKNRRRSESSVITPEHVLASSSIPLLFPATPIGPRYYGDGCIRNVSPLSPALHLGATQALVIGVRVPNEVSIPIELASSEIPSIARIANVLLNSILLDGVEIDVERARRINDFLDRVPKEHRENLNFKQLDVVFISPSEDIGALAASQAARLPRFIRYLIKGLGPLNEASEIISYLLFENEFTLQLIDLGYKDAMSQKHEIIRFLSESPPQ
jgi:NTE family protein